VTAAVAVALAAAPWLCVPVVLLWRMRDQRSLDDDSAEPPSPAPMVSVIVPARDEARNIEPCLRSILRTTWPNVEVIVVDDHSADGTGDLARRAGRGDPRVRVVDCPDLPDGWFGKQWACHNGALLSRGTHLLFTDADTRHGADLLARAMNAATARGADLFSVAGNQTLGTFWERVVQPHIFALILMRYGGTERSSRSRDPFEKIANGQFLLVTRAAYETAGGHAAVRAHVAEDLRLAQEWCRRGLNVQIVAGLDQMTTRMYEGLGELVRGWRKNVYAAGRDTLDVGPAGRMVLRLVYPLPALWEVGPALVAVFALAGVLSTPLGAWAGICYAASTFFWVVMYAQMRQPVRYALLHPLGAAVMFWILASAAWRGSEVEWRGRRYRSQ
jgi:chlorobactene glucosyltransferase